ncbi:MAG: hypothetical protein C7B43_02545 [Sulfobacillus benefaciens]|uniref:Uncharacterized protein n=1 Tax=Sulfobacillus benefaciens TaxID=453960 RepID=A0A2T2X9Z3_9FIRM|nr:MAG: hypothetical protein C7B43_02545 [Sulfobacillus benefaciens]
MIVFAAVVLLGLVGFLAFVIGQFRQIAWSVSQSADTTSTHPQAWKAHEVFRHLLFAPRHPGDVWRWVQMTLLVWAWILAEHAYWPNKAWIIGVSIAVVLWLLWSVQYLLYPAGSWLPLRGIVQSTETLTPYSTARKSLSRSSPERHWWLVTLHTQDGTARIVSSSFSLFRAKLTDGPLHAPQPGTVLQGWWTPAKSPIVWHWGEEKSGSRPSWLINLIWFGAPLLFVLWPSRHSSLNPVIAPVVIVLILLAIFLTYARSRKKFPPAI